MQIRGDACQICNIWKIFKDTENINKTWRKQKKKWWNSHSNMVKFKDPKSYLVLHPLGHLGCLLLFLFQRSLPEGWRCSSCGCCGCRRSSPCGSQGDEWEVPSPGRQSAAPVASAWVSLQHNPAGWHTSNHKLIIRGWCLDVQCLSATSSVNVFLLN